ncbi:UNVERIFIED_CONTAM: hypothetical protein GTU68_040456, partial [Idotea baltica]|nr:hypothetical protein [Idotea baltica]
SSNPPVILVVEDDPADQAITRRALEGSSIESRHYVTSDGAEAIDYLSQTGAYSDTSSAPKPDLALIDLNMPGIDGRELLRTLRSDPRFKTLPVIVLTTSSNPRDVAEIYELGANSYIVKPRVFDELLETLDIVQRYWFQLVELPPSS